MTPVILVSYPRSGHHWLVQLATAYCALLYDAAPVVVPTPKVKPGSFVRVGSFSYCEYYHHCKQMPCVDGALVQKSHDFHLALPIDAELRYVALARDPVPSIVSYHEFTGGAKPWPAFSARRAREWCAFVDKWMLTERPNVLPLMYERLVSDPKGTLSSFLHYCGIPVDPDVMARLPIVWVPARELDPSLDYSRVRQITASTYQRLIQ